MEILLYPYSLITGGVALSDSCPPSTSPCGPSEAVSGSVFICVSDETLLVPYSNGSPRFVIEGTIVSGGNTIPTSGYVQIEYDETLLQDSERKLNECNAKVSKRDCSAEYFLEQLSQSTQNLGEGGDVSTMTRNANGTWTHEAGGVSTDIDYRAIELSRDPITFDATLSQPSVTGSVSNLTGTVNYRNDRGVPVLLYIYLQFSFELNIADFGAGGHTYAVRHEVLASGSPILEFEDVRYGPDAPVTSLGNATTVKVSGNQLGAVLVSPSATLGVTGRREYIRETATTPEDCQVSTSIRFIEFVGDAATLDVTGGQT